MYYNCSRFHHLKLHGTIIHSKKVNWKIHRNSSLKIFEHENIVLCTYHRNLFFNFKQFDHHWKLLKTLDLNTYQGFLFLFFKQLFLVISMNISKIKHHSYETLNLQVYLIILVLTHENLWFWGGFCKEKVIFITGMSFFLFLTHGNEFLSMFWTINAWRIHN